MPDKPAQDVSPEGEPLGRDDPGGGLKSKLGPKIGPLPLGLWMLVGGGIFLFFWWRKTHTSGITGSSAGPPPDPAASGSLPPGSGNTGQTDNGATTSAILQAMQDLANRISASGISPGPSYILQGGGGSGTTGDAMTTTHVTGGLDTARSSSDFLPLFDNIAAIRSAYVASHGPAYKTVTKKRPIVPNLSDLGQAALNVATAGAADRAATTTTETVPTGVPDLPPYFDVSHARSEREAG